MTVNEPGEGQVADLDVVIALADVQAQMRRFRAEMVERQMKTTAIVRESAGEGL